MLAIAWYLCEDLDEALSRVKRVGTLRDYQKEIEKHGNRFRGRTQKALIGTFMGGLKAEISDGIQMFKPKTLKDAISFARMRDYQFWWPSLPAQVPIAFPPTTREVTITFSQLGMEAENLRWRCDHGYQDQHVSEDNQDGDVVVAQEPRKNYANGIKNGTSRSSNVNWQWYL